MIAGSDLQIEVIDLGGLEAGIYSFCCSVKFLPWHFCGEEDIFALKAGFPQRFAAFYFVFVYFCAVDLEFSILVSDIVY